MQIPKRAQIRVLVQVALTIILVIVALALLIGGYSSPSVQKLAAGWLGIVLGYWFK